MTATLPNPTDIERAPHPFHWTVDTFYRAAEAGVFPEPKRIELIRGELIEKMPPSPLHDDQADSIARILRTMLEPRYRVREERAIHIDSDGEPIPDITVVQRGNYRQRHPSPAEAVLLVEVAISSATYDTGGKALLYAQAGITDYWVALPETSTLMVHREPTDAGYQSVTTLTGNAVVSPLSAPEATFVVSVLLGEAEERVQEA